MFCTECGKQLEEGDVFCIHCGARQAPQQKVNSHAREQPAVSATTGTQPSPAVQNESLLNRWKANEGITRLIAGIACFTPWVADFNDGVIFAVIMFIEGLTGTYIDFPYPLSFLLSNCNFLLGFFLILGPLFSSLSSTDRGIGLIISLVDLICGIGFFITFLIFVCLGVYAFSDIALQLGIYNDRDGSARDFFRLSFPLGIDMFVLFILGLIILPDYLNEKKKKSL